MGKESAYDAGDTRDAGLIPGLGRSLWGGNGKPLQYSCLRNARDRGTWWIIQSTGSQRVGHDSTEHTEGIESKEGHCMSSAIACMYLTSMENPVTSLLHCKKIKS